MSEDLAHTPGPARDELSLLLERPDAFSRAALEELSHDELIQLVTGMRGVVNQQEARFACITEIGSALGTTFNVDELLSVIMDKITELMEAERSTLYLLDPHTDELWSKVSQGVVNTEIRLRMGEGIAGWVAMTGKSINIADAYDDPRFNPEVDARTGFQTRSILCQPIRNQEGIIIGVVQVLNRADGCFTAEAENLLSAIASQAAIAIENSKLYLSVVEKNMELLELTDKLEHRVAELDLLYDIERELSITLDLDVVVDSLTRKAALAFDAGAAVLAIAEPEGLRSFFQIREQAAEDAAPGWRFFTRALAADRGICGDVIASGEPYLCNTSDCEGVPGAVHELLGRTVHNAMAVPLFDGDRCIGALKLVNHLEADGAFGVDDLKVLSLIASRIAGTIVARRRHEELEKSNRLAAIGQMLSGVIHDIKNPIAIISGYVQLMARSDDRDKRQDYATSVTKQFEHLKQMTEELLHFARGEQNLLVRKVHLNDFLGEMSELLEEELGNRGIALKVDADYTGSAHFDAGKMKRAVLNLARNAADAMPDGGTFTLGVGLDPDDEERLCFRFSDTGCGVPEEIRESLFDSFVTRDKTHGTGLGLAIVKKIVDEHEGTISFDSARGEGTTFHIRIPR